MKDANKNYSYDADLVEARIKILQSILELKSALERLDKKIEGSKKEVPLI